MDADFTWLQTATELILTASPTVDAEIGTYNYQFKSCLVNYSTICATVVSTFEITPCVVSTFTMISLSPTYDSTYVVGDPTTPLTSLSVSGLTS